MLKQASLNNELWCASCAHAGVCKYAGWYCAVYESIKNQRVVMLSDSDTDDAVEFNDFRTLELPFVLVTPTCTMYDPVARNED